MILFTIPLDGLLLKLDKCVDTLPYPIAMTLELRSLLKDLLALSIGYQNRTVPNESDLGKALYNAGMIPYQIDAFIKTALFELETYLVQIANLRLHYSQHSYELSHVLVIYETPVVKPSTKVILAAEETEYYRRIRREKELEKEKEEAYENEYPQSRWRVF